MLEASQARRQARGAHQPGLIFGLSILVVLIRVSQLSATIETGGLSQVKPADNEVLSLVDKIRQDFYRESGYNISQVINYRTQVVAGKLYHVRVILWDQTKKLPFSTAIIRILDHPWIGPPEVVSHEILDESWWDENGDDEEYE